MATRRRAITLGEAHVGVLDLTVPTQAWLYHDGMKCLRGNKYGLALFLARVQSKAIMYDWFNVITVPDISGKPRNFFESYGMVTMEECKVHARTYMSSLDNRASQSSYMLYQCIADSITTEIKAELTSEADLYTINGQCEGLCFLKLLVSKGQINISVLRDMIRNKIPLKMIELSGNVTEFNIYVKNIVNSFESYGKNCDDSLIMNIFLAYEIEENDDFVYYIKMKRNNWEDGTTMMLTADLLMNHAENYY